MKGSIPMTEEDREIRAQVFGLKRWKTAARLDSADRRDAGTMYVHSRHAGFVTPAERVRLDHLQKFGEKIEVTQS